MTGYAASVPDLTPLLCLLNFPKKSALRILISDVFECRFQGLTKSRREQVKNDLQLPSDAAVDEVVACLVGIMDAALYDSLSKEGVENIFSDDFHPALKGLLADIITTNLPNWREASLKSMVSLPKFVGVDWRVDVKTAASDARGVSEPVALVKMRVEGESHHRDSMVPERGVTVELDKAAMGTLVSTLSRVRDQLDVTAGQRAS
mmetsp:Transcript_23667/g.51659  ORF Transcript_23667/g.51659 Transcript_23667/m.51659 type:complete len:205 (+) Transcript_23667:168-782(+)|eukprot:CAMPEP_0118934398 /NCGR_PEP_ID=MMETSP1169-20130426/13806_1 /TAXON_ID=36882 /ORGANISM="Pyramimonas obovata, Strain CCMP722" /LENGTH=204 /DNA_ID=CAMNT_0006877301 /DNA_START=147 /DNA_END=761 /DNA_ORIENTATION=+